jgi:hypothetical protein
MAKSTKLRKPWLQSEVATVRKLANENTPTRVIGLKKVARKWGSDKSERGKIS